MKIPILAVAFAAVIFPFSPKSMAASEIDIHEEVFGKMPDGREIKVFTLKNAGGITAKVTELGATLISLEAPDRKGNIADVTLGYGSFEDWVKNIYYFGATVGRYGNRIANGKFSLHGKDYTLAINNRPGGQGSSLHGGERGFSHRAWTGAKTGGGVEFTYLSKDGEEGYPGNLEVKVIYTLNQANELTWSARAITDADTVVNLLNHAYFNLSGDSSVSTNDHRLMIAADAYLPTDKGLIPTGERAPVAGTPMDFTQPTAIGSRIGADFRALKIGGGYDHAWVLRHGEGVREAARLEDPATGRVLTVSTDAPAVQFFAANFNGSFKGKEGKVYQGRTAVCLETQEFPDAPNQPEFPTTVLRPGETYRHTVVLKLTVD